MRSLGHRDAPNSIFLAVGDTLNFSRAAERCHVSQPALTRAIQKLEDELGVPGRSARDAPDIRGNLARCSGVRRKYSAPSAQAPSANNVMWRITSGIIHVPNL
jgi:hypothetical protein